MAECVLVSLRYRLAVYRRRWLRQRFPCVLRRAALWQFRALQRGELVLRPADVRLVRLRAERLRPGAAETLDQVLGLQLRRPLAEGLPLLTADLAPPAVVAKNALVVMLLESPGLSLSVQGRAMESAAQGGLVPVMNLESRAVVEAQAIGPGRVRVAMGAVPVLR